MTPISVEDLTSLLSIMKQVSVEKSGAAWYGTVMLDGKIRMLGMKSM